MTADAIRKHYIQEPIQLVDTDYEKTRSGSRFIVNTTIWLDRKYPEYRVIVPEDVTSSHFPENYRTIETRILTYVPTGRIVYDNSLPPAEAIVFEYRLKGL